MKLTVEKAIQTLEADTWFPTMDQSHAIAALIRSLSARNAEMEKEMSGLRDHILALQKELAYLKDAWDSRP